MLNFNAVYQKKIMGLIGEGQRQGLVSYPDQLDLRVHILGVEAFKRLTFWSGWLSDIRTGDKGKMKEQKKRQKEGNRLALNVILAGTG